MAAAVLIMPFEELDKNWDVVYTNYDTINWWFVHSLRCDLQT